MGRKKKIQEELALIGLVDADLLDNGTRHPNLVLLKIAGFLSDNGIPFELILEQDVDLARYSRIYVSRVFSFTQMPQFYERAKGGPLERLFVLGGTGFYATEKDVSIYREKREQDMNSLENDPFLNRYPNHRGGPRLNGIDMARQMPYYRLYEPFIAKQVELGYKKEKYKDYYNYSIGFLTRGCVRHCPFCVNKLETKILPYSKIEWFLDTEKDSNGKDLRPFIYLWDDNFLAADPSVWRPLLKQLIALNKPFQFRQGLDERMLAQSPFGEEMAELLSRSRYHGDFIFAFDNWRDRDLIVKALKIWKKHNPKKPTKFYLFCGYMLKEDTHERFYQDIWELFQRIKILMQYGCIGYVMRHEDYHRYDLSNLYVQIARWCNQPQFYKKMSFWEFVYRNQSYWEEKTLGITDGPKTLSFNAFRERYDQGYYTGDVRLCLPIRTVLRTLDRFSNHYDELLEMFNYKMENLVNPALWQ